MHINKSGTLARMREGKYATIVANAKKMIASRINKCLNCLRTSKLHTSFDPPVGVARFLSLLESSTPIFSGISFDLLGPLKLELGVRTLPPKDMHL